VVDTEGRPLAGARVQLGSSVGGLALNPDGTQGDLATPLLLVSDEDGRFSCDGLPTGSSGVLLGARLRGHGGTSQWVIVASAPAVTAVEVRLPGPTVLEGTVRDAAGVALAGASVGLDDRHLGLGSQTTTDAEGRYRLEDLPARTVDAVRVSASATGYAPAETSLAGDRSATARWDPVLRRSPQMPLRVVDEEGRPMEGLVLQAWVSGFSGYGGHARTDREGRARIDLQGDDTYEVRASTTEDGDVSLPFAHLPGRRAQPQEFEWRIPSSARPSARVRGRVRVESGTLPVGASAGLMLLRASTGAMARVDPATGAFESLRLPPGLYEVSITVPGYGARSLGERRLAADQTLDVGEVLLRAPGRLRVTVERPAGDVGWLNGNATSGTTTTWLNDWSREGVGILPVLQPGAYDVCVLSPQSKSIGTGSVVVESGQAVELTIRLVPAREVKLRFVRPAGTPEPEGLGVRVTPENGTVTLARFQFASRTDRVLETMAWLPPGRYEAHATWEDGAATIAFEVAADGSGSDSVTLTLTPPR
jgi:hypothetical protein